MKGGNWTPFLSGRVFLSVLTKDLGTQGLFVLGYPSPDSLLAPYPAPSFRSSLWCSAPSCCVWPSYNQINNSHNTTLPADGLFLDGQQLASYCVLCMAREEHPVEIFVGGVRQEENFPSYWPL